MTSKASRLRVAYIEHCTPCWPEIAARMRDEMGWEPVYWVGPPAMEAMTIPRFPDLIFHSRYEANHLVSPSQLAQVRSAPLDEAYLRAMSEVELTALKMLDVFDSLDAYSFDERARFFRQRLRYWKSIIEALDLDIVLFPFSPHTVYDYIIQEVCRFAGIRTAMLETTFNFATFFAIESPRAGSAELREQLAITVATDTHPLSDAFDDYVRKTRGSYEHALPYYMRDQFADFPDHLAKNVFTAQVRDDDQVPEWRERLRRFVGRGRHG
jgi:hypothetical protein